MRAILPTDADSLINSRIVRMAAIVDGLAQLGITYREDPDTPFSRAATRSADTVKYPRTTLLDRSGDCDDSAVLVAALLESAGIRTKFVDCPGHILVAAETGVLEDRLNDVALPAGYFVSSESHLWIPIETTELNDGFAHAWDVGRHNVELYRAKGPVSMADAQQACYPASEPPTGPTPPRYTLDREALHRLLS